MIFDNPNYDNCPEKHYARYSGWVHAAKIYKSENVDVLPKYFTLCAIQALDIFTFEKEGILQRDSNRKLSNVIICEASESAAAEIFRLVKPPFEGAIIVDYLEELLTYKDDRKISNLLMKERKDQLSKNERSILRRREKSSRLKAAFPFHIINFDACGNFLKPKIENNKLCQALKKIFELQSGIKSFLLFITTPIYNVKFPTKYIDAHTESVFRSNFQSNVSTHREIADALSISLKTTDYDKIEKEKRVAISFAKSIVIPAANGWDHKHHGIFLYTSPNKTRMLNSVIQFTKKKSAGDKSSYINDIVQIIKDMPKSYSTLDGSTKKQINRHFDEVKQYRENVRKEFSQ